VARNWQECRCGSVVWNFDTHNLPGMCGANITETLTKSPAPTLESPLPAVSLSDLEVTVALPTLPEVAQDVPVLPTLPLKGATK
jgi:hypothetical protein